MFSAQKTHDARLPNMLEDLEDNPKAIGQRLRRVREVLGLSRREFAEKAGLSEQSYGPFELGKRHISLAAAKKMRKTYRIPLEFTIYGIESDLPTRISREL